MSTKLTTTCPGCSCICDDIEVSVEDSKIKSVSNACRKGAALFLNAKPQSNDGIDDEIDEAIEILRRAKKPAIFGLDNTTIEAQQIAIEIAKELDCLIDDYSRILYGDLLDLVLSSKIPTCTLDDVRDRADISIFWGSDAMNSQPRHLSKFSYFPRGEHKQKGWEFDRHAVVIDLYRSSRAKVCSEFFKIDQGGDAAFMDAILGTLSGKPPSSKELLRLINEIKKANFGVIFAGSGLISGLNRDTEKLVGFMEKLNEYSEFCTIPMVKAYNMRGFVETINDSGLERGEPFPQALVNQDVDAALIVGADPLSDLPFPVSRKLREIKTIVIDPRTTPTTEIADVVIHSVINGIFGEGSVRRMDGVEFKLKPCCIVGGGLSDEAILKRIMEGL